MLVARPLSGGASVSIPIVGNATQWTVAELNTGEIVHLIHKEQADPRAFGAFVRKRLKGIYADAGLGRDASWDAFKFEDVSS